MFLSVPWIYEKMAVRITEAFNKQRGLKKRLHESSRYIVQKHNQQVISTGPFYSPLYQLANSFLLAAVKWRIGVHNADGRDALYCASSPLSMDLIQFFLSLDLPICNLYGCTETTGAFTVSKYSSTFRPGSAGKISPNHEFKLVSESPGGVGEICCRSRSTCMGYIWDQKETDRVIQQDGWLHTGDLGHTDRDGYLYIDGRIKEIIITSRGLNIAPVPLENSIKKRLWPLVSNCMVVGDGRSFLSVLLTLRLSTNRGEMG